MLNLLNTVKFIGLAAILFFLIKGFTQDILNDTKIIILVAMIMAIVWIFSTRSSCPKRSVTNESYQIVQPPLVDSIYAGPLDNQPIDSAITNNEFQNRFKNEFQNEFQNESLPLAPAGPMSIYQRDPPERKIETRNRMNQPITIPDTYYPLPDMDDDIEDQKDINAIDKKVYEQLVSQQKAAMKKIVSRHRDDMVYTTTHPFNTVPLGTQLYGYTYMPPENWFRAFERPPVCITDKRSPVCPLVGESTAGLLQFDSENNIRGPEGINLRYIHNILNKQEPYNFDFGASK